jgi:hypothetical protein
MIPPDPTSGFHVEMRASLTLGEGIRIAAPLRGNDLIKRADVTATSEKNP